MDLESLDKCIGALRRAKKGIFNHRCDRFSIALLIAEGYLTVKKDESIVVTPKGERAIEFSLKEQRRTNWPEVKFPDGQD